MPRLWFVGLTLMACVAATAYIITKVPVREMLVSWRMTPEERQAREFLQVAQAEWSDGRYEAVIRMVNEALPKVGTHGAALVDMQARAHEALGDQLRRGPHENSAAEAEALEGAIAKYETALEVGGETAGLVFKLGEAHYLRADALRLEMGASGANTWKARFQQAEDFLKKAIELDGRNLEAYNKLGITYIRLDRNFEAYAHWASVIEIDARSGHAAEARRQLEQNNQNVDAILEQRRASRNTP